MGVHASQHGLSILVMSALISARRVEDKNTDCSNLDTALWSVCVAKRELRNRKTAYVLERRELDAQSVPEGVQRGLARTIHATEWKRANTSDTADVQDTCAGRGEQEGQERLDHRDRAEEVHVEERLCTREVDVSERAWVGSSMNVRSDVCSVGR